MRSSHLQEFCKIRAEDLDLSADAQAKPQAFACGLLVIALQNRSAALPRHILFHAHQKEFFSYRFSKENLPLITLVVQIEWLLQKVICFELIMLRRSIRQR